jgi:hypothetical protein
VPDLTYSTVDDLPPLFESLAQDAMREHEKRFLERTKAAKDAAIALENAASRFETAVHNAWGTMDKSASEYGTRMAQTIEELTRRLDRQQTAATYEDTERFHEESVQALNTIIKTVRKYLPKLRRGLRVEMATLNVALARLETAIRSLGSALDASPGSKVVTIRREVLHFTQVHAEFVKLKADEVEASKAMDAKVAEEREILEKAKELASDGMFLELMHYEDSLKSKEDEIRQFLQPIVKPLSKLERSSSDDKKQSLDIKTLRYLIEKPIEAITTGQTFALIDVLNHLDAAMTHGELEIEERRRRKAEEIIQQVRDGALERLHTDYATIQANVQETLRQLKARGLWDTKNQVDQAVAAISNEKENLANRNTDLRRRIENVNKTVLKEKASLEQEIKQLSGKVLEIQTQ